MHFKRARHSLASGFGGVLLFGTVGMVGLQGAHAGAVHHVQAPRAASGEVLNVSGNQIGGPIPPGCNPFLPTSGCVTMDSVDLVYEPLLQFDLAKSNTVYPWLASSYSYSNGGKTITFNLRKGVTWSDGKPFTSADVVYTFDLLKKYPALNNNGAAFTSVSADGPYTVKVTLSAPNSTELYLIGGDTYIVPEHIWKNVGNPTKYADDSPVGTGPYLLTSDTIQNQLFSANPHYWQPGVPKVKQVDFPNYESNATANVGLFAGKLQWVGDSVPDIQQVYYSKSPYNKAWFGPSGTEVIWPNLSVYPLNLVDVRKAISDAIDRRQVSKTASDFQLPPATSPTGLPVPLFASYLTPQYKGMSYSVNDSEAKSLLKAAGLKMGANGYFVGKNGDPIKLSVLLPAPYTNEVTAAQVWTQELQKIGLDVSLDAVSVAEWTADVDSGNFDLTQEGPPIKGPSPYYGYDGFLDDQLLGKVRTGDFEGYRSPLAQKLLTEYRTGNAAQQNAAVAGLEKIMVNDVPVIPLALDSNEDEYVTKDFTGFPTPSNPYAAGSPYDLPDSEIVLVHLRPR